MGELRAMQVKVDVARLRVADIAAQLDLGEQLMVVAGGFVVVVVVIATADVIVAGHYVQ